MCVFIDIYVQLEEFDSSSRSMALIYSYVYAAMSRLFPQVWRYRPGEPFFVAAYADISIRGI